MQSSQYHDVSGTFCSGGWQHWMCIAWSHISQTRRLFSSLVRWHFLHDLQLEHSQSNRFTKSECRRGSLHFPCRDNSHLKHCRLSFVSVIAAIRLLQMRHFLRCYWLEWCEASLVPKLIEIWFFGFCLNWSSMKAAELFLPLSRELAGAWSARVRIVVPVRFWM